MADVPQWGASEAVSTIVVQPGSIVAVPSREVQRGRFGIGGIDARGNGREGSAGAVQAETARGV